MAIKKSELYTYFLQTCDMLCGGIDASQNKTYVLVLLFVKYISDKYAGVAYAPIAISHGASFNDMLSFRGLPDIGDHINKKIIGPMMMPKKLVYMPDFNGPSNLDSCHVPF